MLITRKSIKYNNSNCKTNRYKIVELKSIVVHSIEFIANVKELSDYIKRNISGVAYTTQDSKKISYNIYKGGGDVSGKFVVE